VVQTGFLEHLKKPEERSGGKNCIQRENKGIPMTEHGSNYRSLGMTEDKVPKEARR
jgi:hypothetical protein